jgi:hypothetical protein
MRGLLLAAIAAAALSAGAVHAAAKPVAEGGVTPEEVRGFLQDAGYKAVVKTEKDGHHHVSSAADGLNFDVYLYDCKGDRCAAIQYYLGFDKGKDTPNLEKVNGYNRDKRFMRAYLARRAASPSSSTSASRPAAPGKPCRTTSTPSSAPCRTSRSWSTGSSFCSRIVLSDANC